MKDDSASVSHFAVMPVGQVRVQSAFCVLYCIVVCQFTDSGLWNVFDMLGQLADQSTSIKMLFRKIQIHAVVVADYTVSTNGVICKHGGYQDDSEFPNFTPIT